MCIIHSFKEDSVFDLSHRRKLEFENVAEMRLCCLWCWRENSHKIHPIENVIDLITSSSNSYGITDLSKSDSYCLTGITPLHAAAVNGDKYSLIKLIQLCPELVDMGDKFGRSPLIHCVLADRLECAEILLKYCANVNKQDNGGRSALHWTVYKGNLKLTKLLVSKGASWKIKDIEGQTVLHLCSKHSSIKWLLSFVKLLETGEIDDQDNHKRTALHKASSHGNYQHVKMLIRQQSNVAILDYEGKTPLHCAARCREDSAADCVKLLIDSEPKIINWQDNEGLTALHLAVIYGNFSIVKTLLNIVTCNASALDNMFRSSLHWAAAFGHVVICKRLIDSQDAYDNADINGVTALHYAVQNERIDIVKLFLYRNLKDVQDTYGRPAFMWAVSSGLNSIVVEFMKYNYDCSHCDFNGATALHIAAIAGHASTVKILLEHGLAIDACDNDKSTPLFNACKLGHTDVVQILIDNGANVESKDNEERNALHWAALSGNTAICQILIRFGVEPNVIDMYGRTPLHCAAYNGFVNCMSTLIEHGIDVNHQDIAGMTALHGACTCGKHDAVRLLIEQNCFLNNMELTEDRYTPLDYALLNEHIDVAQYMLENGALSINSIQDIAATKIQSHYRGYRFRKIFSECKSLLVKHDKIIKSAMKKKDYNDLLEDEKDNNLNITSEQVKSIEKEGYQHLALSKRETITKIEEVWKEYFEKSVEYENSTYELQNSLD